MNHIAKKTENAGMDEENESLRRENEELARQIRRLIKTESRLYAFQEQLDTKLREYKGLHELNGKLIGASTIREMLASTCEYVINALEYERVLILMQTREAPGYSVSAIDGYYDPAERERVAGLVISQDDPLLSPLHGGAQHLICNTDSCNSDLSVFRRQLAMNEYLIFPLGTPKIPVGFLVAGNSAEKADFHHRVGDDEGCLIGIANLAGLLSSSLENRILYENMDEALMRVKEAEARYRNIFENAAEGIFQTDLKGNIINCNPATAVILGYESPDELIESVTNIEHQLFVHPVKYTELIDRMRSRGKVKNFEVELYKKDGSRQWTQVSLHPTLDENGEILCLNGIMLDIAERKRADELIQNSLHEKETLLREIHHRVKNSLQIISTLLDLQAGTVSDSRSQSLFKECQNRIRTIALIHEKLYGTVDFVTINFSEYLESLVHQLIGMYQLDYRITLKLNIKETTAGIDESIPCGLIVNELVTNSLKYAFPDGRAGELELFIDRDDAGVITLTVGDNGIGLPPGFDYRTTETLGLQLVTILVKQLKGSLERQNVPGTVFTIRFQHNPPAAKSRIV